MNIIKAFEGYYPKCNLARIVKITRDSVESPTVTGTRTFTRESLDERYNDASHSSDNFLLLRFHVMDVSSSNNNITITTTTIIFTIKAKRGIIVCFVLFFEIYPASSLGRETLLRDSGGQLISRKCISMVPKQKRVSQEAPLYCRWSSSSGRKRPVAAAPTIRGFTVRIQLFAS
ncbi:hypothetical protein HZH66_003960 [Vespula vulgaris]|uniref:Uncharacterized protein n=1 Tax=Vespula vulgaris TaxID=7454 RepID=A0A836XMH0_VESVU|nr:hypothetical protein HZH66_003960 [Vespula vulgaris]